MRNLFLTCFILALMACRKGSSDMNAPITGTWTMVSVTETVAGQTSTRPAGPDDVTVIFNGSSSGGELTGKTPRNKILPSTYVLGSDHALSLPALSHTKVYESPWGSLFMDNITAANRYQVADGLLYIYTPTAILRFTMEKS